MIKTIKNFIDKSGKQLERHTCGYYAYAQAMEALAKKDRLIDMNDSISHLEIMEEARNSNEPFWRAEDYKGKCIETKKGVKLTTTVVFSLTMKGESYDDFKELKTLFDNGAAVMIGIDGRGKTKKDGWNEYIYKKKYPVFHHWVVLMDYDDDFIYLSDSGIKADTRVRKEYIQQVVSKATYFNVRKYIPEVVSPLKKKLIYPLKEVFITQKFGANKSTYKRFGGWYAKLGHIALDLRTRTKDNPDGIGTDILASHDGEVTSTHFNKYAGNVLTLKGDEFLTKYTHLSKYFVKEGDKISQGQKIGESGNSGNFTTGSHLHFEVWKDGKPVNPENYLK